MPLVHTIAVINQKGGVGKTTTVANLGAALARRGCDVCMIDLDPQAHLTLHFNIEAQADQPSVYDVLAQNASIAEACVTRRRAPRRRAGRDRPRRRGSRARRNGRPGTNPRRRHGSRQASAHDLVLIDCPPSLGLLTLNALAAADEVFIPLQPHFLALQGLGKLLETVALVQRRINPRLKVSGIVLCLYETATKLAAEVVADLSNFLEASRQDKSPWADAHIFTSVIRRNVKLAECPSHGMTIFQYDASSNGAADYKALAEEFAGRYPQLIPQRQPAKARREIDAGDLQLRDSDGCRPDPSAWLGRRRQRAQPRDGTHRHRTQGIAGRHLMNTKLQPADRASKPIRYAMLVVFIAAWVGAFVATHLPPGDVPSMHTSDKVLHMVGYGGLTTLLVLTLAAFGKRRAIRILLAVVILLAYGAFDEITQPAFGRDADLADWLADAAGMAIALGLWEILLAVLSGKKARTA